MHAPTLALSADRTVKAKAHPTSGSPEEWFAACAFSFDFFVDWSDETLQDELWVKILRDPGEESPKKMTQEELERAIQSAYPHFHALNAFSEEEEFQVHYMIFDDSQDWTDDDSVIYDVFPAKDGLACEKVKLKKRIAELTGQRMPIGSKGLIYSTSNLECALSKTDTLWPGDADGLLMGKDGSPLALLEYRKHTKDYPLTSVTNYYNGSVADQRKYNRLNILRDYLDVPLIVLTFPTSPSVKNVQFERIELKNGSMLVTGTLTCQVPRNRRDLDELARTLARLL